ncbi:hypothetical protein HY624_04210 [Candidatus Uhrbacteria bacterium]|nr:hypothetical protein [Candidatus Uhrbacteria bacterium]
MNTPLRGLMIAAVVVALGSAVTTTYLASETASVAADIESAATQPATTTTEPATQATNQTPTEPTCPPDQHFENGPGTPCVWNMDKVPQNQPGMNQQCGPDGCPGQNGPGFRQGPSDEEMQKQQQMNDARMVTEQQRNLKREAKELKNMLQFGGPKKSEAVKKILAEKQAEIKALQDEAAKEGITMDELQAVREKIQAFRDTWQDTMQTLQEEMQNAEQLGRMQREVKNLERGVKEFKKRLAILTKQKIAIPQAISDAIAKVENIVATIKTAKTWAEVEAVGGEDMWGAFQELEEHRQQLEMLSRWPQTLKQLNSQLKNLDRELKRSKTIVDRLAKKEMDLSRAYDEFKAAVDELKAARDRAGAAVAVGNAEEAFDTLENDVFGRMEEVWGFSRRIQTMENLGRFKSQSQQGIADAQRQINNLKRKKIDTSELEDLVSQAKEKRAEVLALLNDKDVEPEDIFSAMQEMDEIRQQFEGQVSELTGQGEKMPWEEGPQQFNSIQAPKGWEGMFQQGGGPGGPGMGPGGPEMGGPGMGPMGPGGPGF